jgi:nucleotide-binding universal stress UspA family protein
MVEDAMGKNTTPNQTNRHIIFVGTDLSEPADEALRQAHQRAAAAGAKLVACHIVPNLMRVNMLFPQRYIEQTEARAELHRQALQALIERTCNVTGRAASDFEAVVDDGTPYASIVEHAEQAEADLIVVGGRGATGLSRMLLGSVAERVIRYAHSPVLVARAGAKTGKVLVATDLSDPSLPAVAAAAREARTEGVVVTAIHCVEPPHMDAGAEYVSGWRLGTTPEFFAEARRLLHEKLTEALHSFDLKGDQRVVEGSPAPTIVSIADEIDADLVILGTRGRTGLERVLLGSVAESVVRHAACSVLVVRLTESGGA